MSLSPLGSYVRARAADVGGNAAEAASGYAAALDAAPDDAVLALRALRQAMAAGDEALALRAAGVLDRAGVLPSDARMVLLTRAVRAKDWADASRQIDRIEKEGAFDFLVPVIRAWIAFGAGSGDPIAILEKGKGGALAGAYAAEHRALLLAARGDVDDSVAAVRATALLGGGGNRNISLRIAVAARLVALGKADKALSLLDGEDAIFVAARARVAAGRSLDGMIDDPAEGISALLTKLSSDISRERLPMLAISLARNALALAPDSSAAKLAMSDALASGDHVDEALAVLDRVPDDDILASLALNQRVALLLRSGDRAAALTAAEAAAKAPAATVNDWSRLGDVRGQAGAFDGAAEAYARAIAMVEAGGGAAPWTLLLLRGSALERAGRWNEARPELEKAAALAPENAMVLNHLGYAQLERGENVDAAMKLVARASALRPEDAAITDSLGWAYYLRGDMPLAIETLERAVKGEPSESAINEHLGDAYWAVGRRYEARYAWRSALVFAEGDAVDRLRGKIDRGVPAKRAR
ncbi:tetratricopeptide (TPR) repeat protein [Sphingomonas zeicaulis]|uniref:tetratricopeptide repeat protein n=1 Tax=Sphingomonas zeicaulis TaxID=1632740 RepID=UPI003D1A82D9